MKRIFKTIVFCAIGVTASLNSFAQARISNNKTPDDSYSKLHLGLGLGMDYGGIGFKAEYLPIKYLGLFGGMGFNLDGPGLNMGALFRPLPDAKFQPILIAMYGYNAVIYVKNWKEATKTYYGFTTGVGGELKVGRKGNRLYLGVLLPFRNQAYKDDYEMVKNSPGIKIDSEPLPVTISIGFNWAI